MTRLMTLSLGSAVAILGAALLFLWRQPLDSQPVTLSSPLTPIGNAPVVANGPLPVAAGGPSFTQTGRDESTTASRNEVSPPDAGTRAQAWLTANRLPTGDRGVDDCIRTIQLALAKPEQNAFHPPSVDGLCSNRDINPLGIELGKTDRDELDQLLAEYQQRLSKLQLDRYLETWMANAALARAGDFERAPNAANYPLQPTETPGLSAHVLPPEAQAEAAAAQQRARERFGTDAVVSSFAGAGLEYCRLVGLNRTNAPEFWDAYERMRVEQAEMSLAIRTFFLQRQRRR